MNLEFLNRNTYRKYPFRSTSSMLTTTGISIPVGLLSSASITVPYTMCEVYVSQIYCKGNYLNVTIKDNKTGTTLGSFQGNVTSDHQLLSFTAFLPTVSGNMTAGTISAIQEFNGSHQVDASNGRIEDSLVFCFSCPGVTSLKHEQQVGTGLLTLALDNITAVATTPQLSLSVPNTSDIFSNADFSTEHGLCPTPIITHINSVQPDENGNIDIYGIAPINISITGDRISIKPGELTLDDVCASKQGRLPPVDDTTSEYHGDILTTETPEWKSW